MNKPIWKALANVLINADWKKKLLATALLFFMLVNAQIEIDRWSAFASHSI